MYADPRGPLRTISKVEQFTDRTELTYAECGHVGNVNQIYSYKIGDKSHCFKCRQLEREELKQ